MVRKFIILSLIFLSGSLFAYEIGDLRRATNTWSNAGVTIQYNRVYRITNLNSSGGARLIDSEGIAIWGSSAQITNRTEDYNPLIEVVETLSFASGVSLLLVFSKGFTTSFGI